MKISDVVYKTLSEVNEMPRFDLKELPRKAKWYLQPLAWLLSFPETIACKAKVIKNRMKGLKGGYILLCNHNSFLDFKVTTKAIFPRSANYIVAIDGFINRENLLRNVGCIGKRKFVSDPSLIRQIKHSLEVNKAICAIYPEARYSLVGTTAILPDSLGKLVKRFNFPVVTLICHGHHLRQPVWNLSKRKVKIKSVMTQLFTKEEIMTSSVEEINQAIRKAFEYDDYRYQVEENIKIDYPDRAKGLHKVLYKCPHCLSDFSMKSDGSRLWCGKCSHTYEMDELGRLSETTGETLFTHIPDWFEWERKMVREEIESGKYHVELTVDIDTLPNSTGYYRLGRGQLTHNASGFHLKADFGEEKLEINKPVLSKYSVHLEYDYFGKGDSVNFSTTDDTYYLFPLDQNYSVTKFHFAVEELYKINIDSL